MFHPSRWTLITVTKFQHWNGHLKRPRAFSTGPILLHPTLLSLPKCHGIRPCRVEVGERRSDELAISQDF